MYSVHASFWPSLEAWISLSKVSCASYLIFQLLFPSLCLIMCVPQMKQTAQEVGQQANGNRLRFMLQDTIDLRNANWVPRRQTTGPKTIEEIRKDAAKEGLIAGPIPPPRAPPMMDRQRPGDRGGMMGPGPSGRMDARLGGPSMGRDMGNARPGMGYPPPSGGRNSYGGGSGDYREQRLGGAPQQAGAGRPPADAQEQQERAKQPAPPQVQAPPQKQRLTEEQMKKRIKSMLEEYVELEDFKEVKATLEEMNSRECFPDTVVIAMEMSFDQPSQAAVILPLLKELFEVKVLNSDEMVKGMDTVLEFLEDTMVDIPAAPKVAAQFIGTGIEAEFYEWKHFFKAAENWWKETKFAPKILGLVLSWFLDTKGLAETKKVWGESRMTLGHFGVEKIEDFVASNSNLEILFPIPKVEKQVLRMLEEGKSDEDIKAWLTESVGDVDRDVSQCLMRCVVQNMVRELEGAQRLEGMTSGTTSQNLIDPEEKASLSKHKDLLRTYLADKGCDQAYALFGLQKYSQDLGHPRGERAHHIRSASSYLTWSSDRFRA
jgi:hypothetical protein